MAVSNSFKIFFRLIRTRKKLRIKSMIEVFSEIMTLEETARYFKI
jgi:hypothetical protein